MSMSSLGIYPVAFGVIAYDFCSHPEQKRPALPYVDIEASAARGLSCDVRDGIAWIHAAFLRVSSKSA